MTISRRRGKISRSRTRYTTKDKLIIAQYQGQNGIFGIVCKRCGRSFPIDIMQVDHINPVARSGKGNPSNLRLLCPTCNRQKGAKKPTKPKPNPLFRW